jgi:hypothetical protein
MGAFVPESSRYQVPVRTPSLEQTYSYADSDGIERTASKDGRHWAFVSSD